MNSLLNVILCREVLYPGRVFLKYVGTKHRKIKKKRDIDKMQLVWTLRYLLQQYDNQQCFTLDCIKTTHIHHSQVPNTEIVAMENLHLNISFTKQYKLTTEGAVPVQKQNI